jgi:tetratricopeptide (TPR) repeat protein
VNEKIDSTVDRVFELQDRLASACLAALDVARPGPGAGPPSPSRLPAYEAYARGRQLWTRMEKGSFEGARELYEQAVAADPRYAPALAGLSGVHALRYTFTTDRRELETAEGYARRAIEADPALGEPHIWLGYSLMRQLRLDEALDEETAAMRLAPDSHYGPYFAGCIRLIQARPLDAVAMYQRAIELGPQAGFNWLGLGWAHVWLGNMVEAKWTLKKTLELEQSTGHSTAGAAGYFAECLRRSGDLEAARAQCLEGLVRVEASDHMYRDIFRGFSLAVLARTALDQGDLPAAQVATRQAVALFRGRPRALGSGFLVVQALAMLARAGGGEKPYEEAVRLLETRADFDFTWFYGCSDDTTLPELARAAAALGRPEEARAHRERARAAGSAEALLGPDA